MSRRLLAGLKASKTFLLASSIFMTVASVVFAGVWCRCSRTRFLLTAE